MMTSLDIKSLGDWLSDEFGVEPQQYKAYWEDFCHTFGDLSCENQKLREQRDAANAVIQELNRIIAGDTE